MLPTFVRRSAVVVGGVMQMHARCCDPGSPRGRAAAAAIPRLFWWWFASGIPAFSAVLAIFWLMIAKPQFTL